MEKNKYTRPTITKVGIDSSINLVLVSAPYTEPEMFIGNSATDDGITNGGTDFQFFNPLKWFK